MKTKSEHIPASSVCLCTTEDFVNPGKVIVTSSFKSSATDYLSLAFSKSAIAGIWIIIIPLIVFCIMALVFDIRWIFVALIFLFLIAPFFIANAYFSKLLTPDARIALARKKIKIISGQVVELYFTDEEDKITSSDTIQWSKIKTVKPRSRSWLIELHDSPVGGIIIPLQSIVEIYEQQNDGNSNHSSDFFD